MWNPKKNTNELISKTERDSQTHTKVNPKWITDLNVKAKIIKLQKNTQEKSF